MFTTILVPLDGSALAERALPHALALADSSGARLLLVRVAHGHGRPGRDPTQSRAIAMAEAEAYLEQLVGRLRTPQRTVYFAVRLGDAADEIAAGVAERRVGLIAMSTHGRSGPGRWLFGSVADAVLRRATVPVLLVPATCARLWAPGGARQIVVPLDGSPLAAAALEPAVALARHFGAGLVLVRVVAIFYEPFAGEAAAYVPIDADAELAAARRYLDEIAAPLRASGLAVATRAEVGFPAATIAAVANEVDAMLVALATHGRGGIGRMALGSVATGTIQRAEVPLLLVRPFDPGLPAERVVPGDARSALLLSGEELAILERGLHTLLAGEYPAESTRALLARVREAERQLVVAG